MRIGKNLEKILCFFDWDSNSEHSLLHMRIVPLKPAFSLPTKVDVNAYEFLKLN